MYKTNLPVVRSSYRMESFLTCSVPNLQFDLFTTQFNGFDLEVNANSADKSSIEGIITESEEDTSFAYSRVANK